MGAAVTLKMLKNTNISARDLDADQDPPRGGGGVLYRKLAKSKPPFRLRMDFMRPISCTILGK